MRKTVVAVCGTTLFMGLLTGPANATPATNGGCPMGYEPATLEQILATPEVVVGIGDGIYPESHIVDTFNVVNQNGDDLVCWKSVANDDNMHFMVWYAGRYMDNHAGPKK